MWKSKNRKKIEALESSINGIMELLKDAGIETCSYTTSCFALYDPVNIKALANCVQDIRNFLGVEYNQSERKLQRKKKGKK